MVVLELPSAMLDFDEAVVMSEVPEVEARAWRIGLELCKYP
jgi:hypothetical protein